MGQHEQVFDAIQDGSEVKLSSGFDYDGSMCLFVDSLAQVSGVLVRQMLAEFPGLIKRQMKISYTESDILPPDKKIKYPHSHVNVSVTWIKEIIK